MSPWRENTGFPAFVKIMKFLSQLKNLSYSSLSREALLATEWKLAYLAGMSAGLLYGAKELSYGVFTMNDLGLFFPLILSCISWFFCCSATSFLIWSKKDSSGSPLFSFISSFVFIIPFSAFVVGSWYDLLFYMASRFISGFSSPNVNSSFWRKRSSWSSKLWLFSIVVCYIKKP